MYGPKASYVGPTPGAANCLGMLVEQFGVGPDPTDVRRPGASASVWDKRLLDCSPTQLSPFERDLCCSTMGVGCVDLHDADLFVGEEQALEATRGSVRGDHRKLANRGPVKFSSKRSTPVHQGARSESYGCSTCSTHAWESNKCECSKNNVCVRL